MDILSKRKISVFSLVMINIIAIDSLRTLPMSAEYGFTLIFYYLLAGVVFFIPTTLVVAELATGWAETGGVYVWVREAFGKKAGFITVWLQWFYNICWYPTIMSLIAATIAYTFNPSLADNRFYMLAVIMVVFWGATLVNCLGMRASSAVSTLSAIAGTLVPMIFIIILGVIWWLSGRTIHIDISAKSFFPEGSHINELAMLTAILYGLVGIEMSAAHAKEVENPSRSYPKAAFVSMIIILGTLMFSSLAIAVVVPAEKINLVTGLLQAFQIFFKSFHMEWVMPILAILIVLGSIGCAAAWMLGPSKGLLMASRDGSLPAGLSHVTSKNVPVRILILQGIIFTLLSSVFLFMPSVSSSFWVLTDITAILALIVYVAMFSAAIYLRYKYPDVKRAFKIPGGKVGLWITCLLGISSCLFAIFIGFIPPTQVEIGNIFVYESVIIGGVVLGFLLPLFIYLLSKK